MPDLASDSANGGTAVAASDDLDALLSQGGSTALLAIRGGEVVFARGHNARRSSVASVRKSLIGILYGIAVA
jgi:hypothetical protein